MQACGLVRRLARAKVTPNLKNVAHKFLISNYQSPFAENRKETVMKEERDDR